MESFRQILLDVWREACRHIELGEFADTILRMLQEHMPLERLLFYGLDAEQCRLVLAADAPDEPNWLVSHANLPRRGFNRLLSWVREGNVARLENGAAGALPLSALRLPEDAGDLLVAGLSGPHDSGIAVLIPVRGGRFLRKHEQMLTALQEPFAVALENDRRLHELGRLREAAEADRRSLLRRLGRKELADPVVGEESGLRQVMERVRQIRSSDVPVLILGETGTGKELIARAIHSGSDRSGGPFIRVNCGAIPPELIDSQLFGHEKGSFTGAVESRQGWFERADGGTLFLDEIGELPPNAQVRFLRVLQDGFVERVGGGHAIHVDVRVVAATHRDLAQMVREGRFREDLWYRIAVFPILLPPLRERLDDIPALVEHFAEKAANRFGLPVVKPTEPDLALLRAYDWPGNIRELAAVIDRAAILGQGTSLDIGAALGFSKSRIPGPSSNSGQTAGGVRGNGEASAPFATLNEVIQTHIERALVASRGRVEGPHGAAALLDINPHTLRARMRKLGIDWASFRNGS